MNAPVTTETTMNHDETRAVPFARQRGGYLLLTSALALACAAPSPELDSVAEALSASDQLVRARTTYDVAGDVTANISGEMSGSSYGRFAARLLATDGQLTLESFRVARARTSDTDPHVLVFVVHNLLGHDDYLYDVDCHLAASTALARDASSGTYSAPTGLAMECRALDVSGSTESWYAFHYALAGVRITHDPDADRFTLDGLARGVDIIAGDGDVSDLAFVLDGRYQNVPPVPRIALAGVETAPNVDDGCPARPSDRWNGLPVVEATSMFGWTTSFRAATVDRDGLTSEGDVAHEMWWVDGAYAGDASYLPEHLYAIDQLHTVELVAEDYASSSAAATPCRFVVADTTPPRITSMGESSRTFECTGAGGAQLGDDGLAWLRSFDVSDPGGVSEPVSALEATYAGAVVTSSTVLALGDHDITLVARDARGNEASASRHARVVDTIAPWLWLWFPPEESVLVASNKVVFLPVHPLAASGDTCSVATRRLYKITTNDGTDVSTLVRGADLGTDDTELFLAPRLTTSGAPRSYFVTYVATDDSGNVAWQTGEVRVTSGTGS